MLDTFRKRSSIITIVVAFVFIVGMALVGLGDVFNKQDYAGTIGKKKIKIQDYANQLQEALSSFSAQSPSTQIDESVMKYLNDNLWNSLVQQVVVDMGIKEFKIEIDDEEIIQKIKTDPPGEIQNSEDFQTDGVYDSTKYQTALQSGMINIEALEEYFRNILPIQKLEQAVMKGVIIPEEDVRQAFIEDNEKIDAKIIWFDPNRIKLDEKISDDEIKNYYETGKESDFKKGPTRKVTYVVMRLEPTEADIQQAKEDVEDIYNQIIADEQKDFVEFIDEYSDDKEVTTRGDLGYISRGDLRAEFEDVAFDLEKGEVSRPFETTVGWHIIKAVDIKTVEGELKVKLSHLFVEKKVSNETAKKGQELANSFFERTKVVGFETAAVEFDLGIDTSSHLGESFATFPIVGKDEKVSEFVFNGSLGDISEPIFANDAYTCFKISTIDDDIYLSLEEVKDFITTNLETEKKQTLLPQKVEEFLNKNQDYLTLAEIENWEILDAKKLTVSQAIPGLGKLEDLSEALFSSQSGNYTSVVTNSRGSFIGFVTKRSAIVWDEYEQASPQIKERLYQTKKTQQLNAWFQSTVQKLKIIDNRKTYFSYL